MPGLSPLLPPFCCCLLLAQAQLVPPGPSGASKATPTQGEPPGGVALNAEKTLYESLLRGYNRNVRPVRSAKDVVHVEVAQAAISVEDLVEREQVMTVHAMMRYTWTDQQLAWNPADHEGVTVMRFPVTSVWTPAMTLFNSKDKDIYRQDEHTIVAAYSNGTVVWLPNLRLHVGCPMDLRSFPYDEQTCIMMWGSLLYDDSLVNLTWASAENALGVSVDMYIPHKEWRLVQFSGARHEHRFEGRIYPFLMFSIKLARSSDYQAHLFVAPSVALSLLLPSVFLLPPGAAERTTLGAAVLLAHVLLFSGLQQYLPTAHAVVPTLGQYYLANIVLTGIALFLAALVTNVWSKASRSAVLPQAVRTLFLGVFGRLLRVPRGVFLPVGGAETNGGQRVLGEEDMADAIDAEKAHYVRVVNEAEWRQLAVILDRLFFLLFLAVAVFVLLVMR